MLTQSSSVKYVYQRFSYSVGIIYVGARGWGSDMGSEESAREKKLDTVEMGMLR